ncbi:MAG: hypothetical protein ACPIOQ_70140 [Promethearchaeia archaeon]
MGVGLVAGRRRDGEVEARKTRGACDPSGALHESGVVRMRADGAHGGPVAGDGGGGEAAIAGGGVLAVVSAGAPSVPHHIGARALMPVRAEVAAPPLCRIVSPPASDRRC